MPQHKSCEKRMRSSRGRNRYNRAMKSAIKTAIKKLQNSEGESLEPDFREVVSDLDRAARKGVIPKNRADRRKSRLAKQLARKKAEG
jgi:small subunit ribosomal protein S20